MSEKKEGLGFAGILKGVTDLVGKLGELADKGEELSKSGTIDFGGKEKDMKGVYGFSVKVGLGGDGVKVEPFGNIRKDEVSGEPAVQEISEPVVDLFEEKDHILIVAEMPGISTADVQLDVEDDLLILYAEKGEKKYRKEILLPKSYSREKMQITANNGIVEIKCSD